MKEISDELYERLDFLGLIPHDDGVRSFKAVDNNFLLKYHG